VTGQINTHDTTSKPIKKESNRLGVDHECDKQTDRRTDGQNRR